MHQASATSSTSLTIGTGSKSLTLETGKQFTIGQTGSNRLYIKSIKLYGWTNYCIYSGTGAMTVNVVSTGGSGTALHMERSNYSRCLVLSVNGSIGVITGLATVTGTENIDK